jgi:branched-chain amino acid transport system ATP-binding protein
VLEIRHLAGGYLEQRVLQDVSLDLAEGEVVSLVGRNGCGKSTLVKCLMGYLRPAQGRIRLDGHDLVGHSTHELVRLGMTAVLQERSTFGGLPVRDNLLLGGYSLDRQARARRVAELMQRFPLLHERRAVPANRLSSGEQRILELARALVPEPRILVLDEVTIGLAGGLVEEIRRLVRELSDQGTAILIVESQAGRRLHEPGSVFLLENGRLREAAPDVGLLERLPELSLDGAAHGAR